MYTSITGLFVVAFPLIYISLALNTPYCRLRLKNEFYIHIYRLVCCGIISGLIFSFALNPPSCRSCLKNEV